MSSVDKMKLKKLHCTFPKLTETNQFFVLGLAEGLKHAQVTSKGKQTVKKEYFMKKIISGITILVIGLLLVFTGCNEDPGDSSSGIDEKPGIIEQPTINTRSPNAPLRAVAVPPPMTDPTKVEVLDFWTDGTNNYYMIDGGVIKDIYIGTIQEVPFDGITPVTSIATAITTEAVTTSIRNTAFSSYRYEELHKAKVSTSVGIGPWKASASWTGQWKKTTYNEKSTEEFTEIATTVTNQAATAFTVGEHGQPAGWYRIARYAREGDLFFLIVTSRDRQEFISWEAAICIRENRGDNSYFTNFEYSANNDFDNNPVNQLTLPVDFWKALPPPEIDDTTGRFSAGEFYSLAIDENNNLWAWGRNNRGQLGDNSTTLRNKPVKIRHDIKFSTVSAGAHHSLAIDVDGNLWAWGRNTHGQIGDGTTTQRNSPVQVRQGTKFIAISAGAISISGFEYVQTGQSTIESASFSLAIDENNNLWAWGRNNYGQLGIGNTTDSRLPLQVKPGTKFKAIYAGTGFSLAIDIDGNLWTWGHNHNGQLGDGTTTQRNSPVPIKHETKFTKISGGGHVDEITTGSGFGRIMTPTPRSHSLAIDVDGNLWAWGNNLYGQLGIGNTTQQTRPVQVSPGRKFKAISTGAFSSLAIDENNTLWVWGRNNERQLGTGNTTNRNIPVLSNRGDLIFTGISSNGFHGLAMCINGGLWVWGRNNHGQLGRGDTTPLPTPTRINF